MLYDADGTRIIRQENNTTTLYVAGSEIAGESIAVPDVLKSRLPNPTREPWSVTNCAKVAACSKAINAGANLEDLVTYTVRTKTGEFFAPCENCKVWLPGGRR